MNFVQFLLFLSLFVASSVHTQVVEIRGELQASMSASMKYSVIRDARAMVALRDELFKIWQDLINWLRSSKILTYSSLEVISNYETELARQKRLVVKFINTEFYLRWYNELRVLIDKNYMATKVNDAVEKFLATLSGPKKIVRCWLAGKNETKECLQYSLASLAFANVTNMMMSNYTSYKNTIKSLLDDGKKNVNDADTVNYFLTRNNETLWKALSGFIGSVEYFSNDKDTATKEVLDSTFDQQLPKCEEKMANMTECINTKVTKVPKVTAA